MGGWLAARWRRRGARRRLSASSSTLGLNDSGPACDDGVANRWQGLCAARTATRRRHRRAGLATAGRGGGGSASRGRPAPQVDALQPRTPSVRSVFLAPKPWCLRRGRARLVPGATPCGRPSARPHASARRLIHGAARGLLPVASLCLCGALLFRHRLLASRDARTPSSGRRAAPTPSLRICGRPAPPLTGVRGARARPRARSRVWCHNACPLPSSAGWSLAACLSSLRGLRTFLVPGAVAARARPR